MRFNRPIVFWICAFALLILLLALLKDILLPFVAGMIIAYFLDPVADRLVAAGLSRTLASVIIVAVGGPLFISLIIFLAPLISEQAQQLAAALPAEASRLRDIIDGWARQLIGDRYPGLETGLKSATEA